MTISPWWDEPGRPSISGMTMTNLFITAGLNPHLGLRSSVFDKLCHRFLAWYASGSFFGVV